MPGQVIHVGMDYWQRMLVLNACGLRPKLCNTPQSLNTLLTGTGTVVDAVVISSSPGLDVSQATEVARTFARCPVILFPLDKEDYDEDKYDLMVQPLTPPHEWLEQMQSVIKCCQQTREQSQESSLNQLSLFDRVRSDV